jgi:hypothetical protein
MDRVQQLEVHTVVCDKSDGSEARNTPSTQRHKALQYHWHARIPSPHQLKPGAQATPVRLHPPTLLDTAALPAPAHQIVERPKENRATPAT